MKHVIKLRRRRRRIVNDSVDPTKDSIGRVLLAAKRTAFNNNISSMVNLISKIIEKQTVQQSKCIN